MERRRTEVHNAQRVRILLEQILRINQSDWLKEFHWCLSKMAFAFDAEDYIVKLHTMSQEFNRYGHLGSY